MWGYNDRVIAAALAQWPADATVNKRELAKILRVSTKTLSVIIDGYGDKFPIEQPGSHSVSYKFRVHDVLPFLSRKMAEARQATCLQAKMVEDLAIGPDFFGTSNLPGLSGHQQLALARARREQREVERLESRLVQRDNLIETVEIVFDVLLCQIDALLDDLPQRFDLVGEKEKYVREQVEDILPRMADIFFERLGLKFAFLKTRLGRTGE
jgi:hypothetical protein